MTRKHTEDCRMLPETTETRRVSPNCRSLVVGAQHKLSYPYLQPKTTLVMGECFLCAEPLHSYQRPIVGPRDVNRQPLWRQHQQHGLPSSPATAKGTATGITSDDAASFHYWQLAECLTLKYKNTFFHLMRTPHLEKNFIGSSVETVPSIANTGPIFIQTNISPLPQFPFPSS